jgi:hypothetical protein
MDIVQKPHDDEDKEYERRFMEDMKKMTERTHKIILDAYLEMLKGVENERKKGTTEP